MNANEKNRISMYLAVIAVLEQHKELITTIPALVEIIGQFDTLVADIIARDQKHETITAGVIAEKNGILDTMAATTLRFAKALYALGRKTGNEQLKEECDVTMSDLMHRRQVETEQYCLRIAELAGTHAADLEAYGIAAGEIEEFVKATEAYREATDTRDRKFTESKATHQVMHNMFKKADDILKEDLDTILETLREKDPDFYLQYKAARNIHDLGGSHSSKEQRSPETEVLPEPAVAAAAAVEG